MYRQTLFCRATAPRNDVPDRDRLDGLHAYSPMHSEDPDTKLDDDSVAVFVGRHDARMRTDHPAVKQAFARLGKAWPSSHPISELTAQSVDPDAVRQAILGGHAAGLVQLTSHAPAIATAIGECPETSALARAQVADGAIAVTNLKHERIPIADADGSRLIALLDGTRGRDELLGEMEEDEPRLRASLDRLKDLGLLTTRP
jgi:hypothetical protein